MAEGLSGEAATDDDRRTVWVPLINVANRDLVIESISLSADVETAGLQRFRLGSDLYFNIGGGVPLPTGTIPLTGISEAERTVYALESPLLEIRFARNPRGTVTYTLVLNFTEGTSSTIVFTVQW